VLGGVKEVREIVAAATARTKPTLLFVDELHRFSRSQQDAFLPHIEAGTIIFVGATTENPSFYLTGALLSRTRVVQFAGLSEKGMRTLIKSGGESIGLALHPEAEEYLLSLAQGDARVLLNMLEQLNAFKKEGETLSLQSAEKILGSGSGRYYDRTGEEHYNLASAFIKSLRGF
jgi:putative ATPase